MCGTNCSSCTSAANCVVCLEGNFLQPKNMICAATCPGGYFISGSGCTACSDNCSACTSAVVCTACSVGVLTAGSCISPTPVTPFPIVSSYEGEPLRASIKSVLSVAGTHYHIQVDMSAIPPLPSSTLALFYKVVVPPGVSGRVYQFPHQTKERINIFVTFTTKPPLSTVIALILNTDLVAQAYKDAGYTDLTKANLRFALSSARNAL